MASPECRMDKLNLARVFGPTIVGHSNPDPHPLQVFKDTEWQPKVVGRLLSLPSDYWTQFVPVGQAMTWAEPSACGRGLFTSASLFKPLTSPDVAEMNKSPTCCIPPSVMLVSGRAPHGKIFPSLTLT
ncbi:rac GTPase-activating protein 1-like [Heptranchias perlo]|uniref:rac GTPase-activating protein 1-like n=1 Tax=Heptranchias perlo TaxID=212740 RepID=UPI00355A00EE